MEKMLANASKVIALLIARAGGRVVIGRDELERFDTSTVLHQFDRPNHEWVLEAS
jgi:hypothetical protein